MNLLFQVMNLFFRDVNLLFQYVNLSVLTSYEFVTVEFQHLWNHENMFETGVHVV